jgi:hypothetical protein
VDWNISAEALRCGNQLGTLHECNFHTDHTDSAVRGGERRRSFVLPTVLAAAFLAIITNRAALLTLPSHRLRGPGSANRFMILSKAWKLDRALRYPKNRAVSSAETLSATVIAIN